MRFVFFAHNRDVMIRAVKSGTHQVGHAGIKTGKFFISVFNMQNTGNQITIRTGDIAAAFRKKFNGGKTIGNNNFFIFFLDAAAYCYLSLCVFAPAGREFPRRRRY